MLDEVRGLPAWQNAGPTLRQAIGDFYAQPCSLGPSRAATDTVVVVIELTTTDVTFELALGAERARLRALATSMLGPSDEADALSLLLETANIAMGRFQASLIAAGRPCTLGLPRLAPARQAAMASLFHVSCRGVEIDVTLTCDLKARALRPFETT